MGAQVVPAAPSASSDRKAHVGLWVLQGGLAAFFLLAAASKLLGEANAVEMFDQIGLGQPFRYVVGGLELAGAIGLVIPRLARLAALGLAGLMVGATITSLVVLDAGPATLTPALLLALLGVVARGRRPRTGG